MTTESSCITINREVNLFGVWAWVEVLNIYFDFQSQAVLDCKWIFEAGFWVDLKIWIDLEHRGQNSFRLGQALSKHYSDNVWEFGGARSKLRRAQWKHRSIQTKFSRKVEHDQNIPQAWSKHITIWSNTVKTHRCFRSIHRAWTKHTSCGKTKSNHENLLPLSTLFSWTWKQLFLKYIFLFKKVSLWKHLSDKEIFLLIRCVKLHERHKNKIFVFR